MNNSVLKLDCEVLYDTEKGIEIRLRHDGNLSSGVIKHLARAGDEVLLALEQLAGNATRRPQEKVRKKIEIDEPISEAGEQEKSSGTEDTNKV
jgi:hypothetical protein